MQRTFHRSAALLVAALAITMSSCGSAREERLPETGATLEGVITYGGEPVNFAMVMVSGGGAHANGKVESDGRYVVQNVPLGPVQIAVNTAAAQGDFMSASMASGAYQGPEAKKAGKSGVKFVTVPQKYFDPATSGISTEVAKGKNTFDIVIAK